MPNVKVGEKAPDFTLNNQDGKSVSLSDCTGINNVVLFFYPKDFSPGCTKQACRFRDSYEDFTDLGAVVIGISDDSLDSIRDSLEQPPAHKHRRRDTRRITNKVVTEASLTSL
jgi:peroxiredoxin